MGLDLHVISDVVDQIAYVGSTGAVEVSDASDLQAAVNDVLLAAANHLLKCDRWQLAELMFRAVLVISSDEARALDGLGLLRLLRSGIGQKSNLLPFPNMVRAGESLCVSLGRTPESGFHYLHLGHAAREGGDLATAVIHYQKAVELEPNHTNLVLDVAFSLLALRQFDLSEVQFEKVRQAGDDARAFLGLGHIARLRGERKVALGFFTAASSDDSGNGKVEYEIATELVALQRFDEATTIYERLITLYPGESGPRFGLAQIAGQLGDANAMVQHIDASLVRDPDNIALKVDAGNMLFQSGKPELATTYFNAALVLEPTNANALVGLGRVALQAENYLDASGYFVSASIQDPGRLTVRLDAGFSLLKSGSMDSAGEQFRQALILEPESAEASLGMAHVATQQGKSHSALNYLNLAIQHGGANLNLQLDAGYRLLELGEAERAENLFDGLAVVNRSDPRVLAGLAHAARNRGDYTMAAKRFAAAVEHDPSNVTLRLDTARNLLNLCRAEDADVQLEMAASLAPDDPRVFAALGQAAQHQGDYAKAAVWLEAAVSRNPAEVDIRLEAGFSQLASGQVDAAEAHFTAAAELDPNNSRVHAAHGFLARKRGDMARAASYFRAAGEIAPAQIEWRLELAADLMALGDPVGASQVLAIALVQEPTHRGALMALGYLHRESGDHDKALMLFNRILSVDPAFQAAVLAAAEELRALGRPDEARAFLKQALAVEPDNLYALMQLIAIQGLGAAWDQCLETARTATAFHPRRAEPYLEAARALMEMGCLSEALMYLDEGLMQAGPMPSLMVRQAEILRRNGRWDEAAAALDRASDVPGSAFSVWTERVNLMLATGAWERARQAVAPFPASSPLERALACHILATIAEKTWHFHEAAALNRAALAFRADAGFAHIALGRIGMLLLDMPAALHHQAKSCELEASATILRNGNLRASQTHVGQILDEFRMVPALIGELKELLHHPAGDRVGELTRVVRDQPDHMAPAMQLVVALRQSGLLDWHARMGKWPGRPIPRRIFQYWNDGEPPQAIESLMLEWRRMHPDWEYICFDDNSAGAFIRTHHSAAALEAFRYAKEPAHRADLFRLAVLKTLGGVYIDADDICLARLESVLPMQASLIGYLEHYGTLANNFIAATAEMPVIGRAFDLAIKAMRRGDDDIIWLSTGPGLLTRAFCQELSKDEMGMTLLAQCCILEPADHSRVAMFHAPAPYKSTRRHWLRRQFERVSGERSFAKSDAMAD